MSCATSIMLSLKEHKIAMCPCCISSKLTSSLYLGNNFTLVYESGPHDELALTDPQVRQELLKNLKSTYLHRYAEDLFQVSSNIIFRSSRWDNM